MIRWVLSDWLTDPVWDLPQWPIQWGVVLGASLVAAGWDVRTGRIPNLLTGPLWVGGLVFCGWAGGLGALGEGLAASVLVALPYLVLFALGAGGAGDAKMMGAIGAWVGIAGGVMVVAAVAVSGWLLGLIWAIRRRAVRQVAEHAQLSVWETIRVAKGSGRVSDIAAAAVPTAGSPSMRYGVAILMGVCLAAIGRIAWLG